MHYIVLLDDRSQKISRTRRRINITLRGYNYKAWVPSELSHIGLPVYMIAYSPCPTYRDIYLEVVNGMRRQPTWERYRGRIIDHVYKSIHSKCESYALNSRARSFDLYTRLINEQTNIMNDAKNKYSPDLAAINPPPSPGDIASLDKDMTKLITFEAKLTDALMNFQIAKVRSASPGSIFSQYFDFVVDPVLRAPHQGIRDDAIPDFIYRHQVIGDIKAGTWKEFYEQTVVAYALAYEEHTKQDMNYGVILHAEFTKRNIPSHHRTSIEILDDVKRKRYFVVRDRKLEIINRRSDPGLPARAEECDPGCPFLSDCWRA